MHKRKPLPSQVENCRKRFERIHLHTAAVPTPAVPIPESGSPTGADAAEGESATAEPSSAAEKKESESSDETGEAKCAAAAMSAKDVEMKDTECNYEMSDVPSGLAAAADPVRYQTSDGKRRRVAARIDEAVEYAMDSGDVGMIMAVQEAIDLEEGEQEEPDEIWNGKEWIDPRLVREGRLDELKRLKHFDVYEVVDASEATGQIVDAKWVNRQKRSVVRSRIVARQFATKSLEHLFVGTLDATVLGAILSKLATDKDKVLLVADITSAYYQAPVVIDQYVRPPTDQRDKGKLWKLKRAMPCLRIASRSWQDHYASVVEEVLGQRRSLVDSCAFAQQEDGTISAIWSDDLVGSGYRANMEVMKEKLHEALECNTGELVGVDAALAKEATFTKRTIRCVPDAGWELEADTKHVKTLLQWFECEDARGSPVPGSKDARRPLEHETVVDGTTTVLDQEERAEYRKHVGLLQYITNVRFDLKYAVKEVIRDAARPTVVSRRMVKKIVRYLKSVPRAVLCFGWSERGDTVVVTVDADHAGCSETRRSTSSGVIQVNDHVLSE